MSEFNYEAANDAASFFGLGDWYFMNSEQRAVLHKERLLLMEREKNSAELAKQRIKERIARRNG